MKPVIIYASLVGIASLAFGAALLLNGLDNLDLALNEAFGAHR